MDIFLPYTDIQPLTRGCLRQYDYRAVKLKEEDSYSVFLENRWDKEEDFINVEHDVIFWQNSVESLQECPYSWCTFTRAEDSKQAIFRKPTLCLARFRKELLINYKVDWKQQRTEPNEWKQEGLKVWQYCDMWIRKQLCDQGLEPHYHDPPIINANPSNLIYSNIFPAPTEDNFFHRREIVY